MKIQASTRLAVTAKINEGAAHQILQRLGITPGKVFENTGLSVAFQIDAEDADRYADILTKKFGHAKDVGFGASKAHQWLPKDKSATSINILGPGRGHPFPLIEVIDSSGEA